MDIGTAIIIVSVVAMTLVARFIARNRPLNYKPTAEDPDRDTGTPRADTPAGTEETPNPRRRAAYGAARARTKLKNAGD